MTIDMTGVAVSIVGGVFSVAGPVFLYWLQQHLKDKQAAAVLSRSISSSLGAMQRAAEAGIKSSNLVIQIPGVPPELQIPVQYVLDHAGDEAARLGITPQKIAGKIDARIGLANIETNIATAASPAPTPQPLDPVPAPEPAAAPAREA